MNDKTNRRIVCVSSSFTLKTFANRRKKENRKKERSSFFYTHKHKENVA